MDDTRTSDNTEYSLLPATKNNDSPSPKKLSKVQSANIAVFAWLGCTVCYFARLYPSGYYLKYLQDNYLDKTIGTIVISTFMLTMLASPYIVTKVRWLRHMSMKKRCLLYTVLSVLSGMLLTMVDKALEWDNSGCTVYIIIGLVRSVQGGLIGLLYILFQGEIVDMYFKTNKLLVGIISSGIHIGGITSSIIAAELYDIGGWTLMSPIIACFTFLPLVFLPFVRNPTQVSVEQQQTSEEEVNASDEVNLSDEVNVSGDQKALCPNAVDVAIQTTNERSTSKNAEEKELISSTLSDKDLLSARTNTSITVLQSLTARQTLAYFMPDLAVFLNNLAHNMLIYVLPARMVAYNNMTLSNAVNVLNIFNVNSFIASLALSYIATKKIDAFNVMLVGNVCLYTGGLLMYGSTTEFLAFNYAFEIGSVLGGIGDAAIINICILSKFSLFEKWKISLDKINLGVEASTTYNFVMAVSGVCGTVFSAFSLTRSSEIPTVICALVAFVCTSAGLLISKCTS